ncbi:YitT family protein [Bacillus sp. PS06]|uniref:YitT family protein n=1 Tax=Bacillus sp. PS06 TaxID=2764176 RepID=UPI0017834416|nr:YitT family protein [Bacillus sp. PS06]MBD8067989.1 YitT family protein [Bacillus sp. PS06]
MNLIKKLIFVFLGLLLTSLGIKLLSLSLLTFGGTAGIATILTYITEASWGIWFFIVNLPFFIISYQQLGKWFTLSSLLSITAISFIRDLLDLWIPPFEMNMLIAAILSGLLIGIGVTFVLNNGSSLGGIHILGLFFEKKLGLNRGLVIFICDSLIILFALAIVGWSKALLSVLCIFIASSLIGRYKKSPIKKMEKDSVATLEKEQIRV